MPFLSAERLVLRRLCFHGGEETNAPDALLPDLQGPSFPISFSRPVSSQTVKNPIPNEKSPPCYNEDLNLSSWW